MKKYIKNKNQKLFPQANVHQANIKIYYNPFFRLGVCRGLLGLEKANQAGRLWHKAIFFFFAISKGSRTKKNKKIKKGVFKTQDKTEFYLGNI